MRIRTIVVVVAAIAAFAATAAGASAAEPAFFECAKLKGGGFADKLCSEGAGGSKGKYELAEGVATKTELTAKINELTVAGESFELSCTKSALTGRITGPKTVGHVLIELTNCELGGVACGASVGHHRGVIELGPLAGTLGYISASGHTVGIELEPETGTILSEFGCKPSGPPQYRLRGALFGAVSGNVNSFTKIFGITPDSGAFEGGESVGLQAEQIEGAESEAVTVVGSTWRMKTKTEVEVKA
jgi:hypothetical protein